VIDEVGSLLQLYPKVKGATQVVDISDIEDVVAMMAKVPKNSVESDERDQLKTLSDDLKLLIYGQDEAVDRVVDAILLSRSGLGNNDKPIANFLFTGPTGVGKTELSKQLAYRLGIHFERFDMSEYMEKHSVAKLIGAPPGYIGHESGGLLTEAVNKHAHCVLLLDEVEKAHPDIFNILLQVMDSGRLTDSNGRTTDFRNVILIMTSNVGAREAEAGSIGLAIEKAGVKLVQSGPKENKALKNAFSPEFRNRLDAVIAFNGLSKQSIQMVVEKFLVEIERQLEEKKVQFEVGVSAKEWLGDTGYDPKMGARPISRLINEQIKKVLANELLFGKLSNGGRVKVQLKEEKLIFEYA
jgi:ATP-dependent Clp protease ATP-binding subunit ClpA